MNVAASSKDPQDAAVAGQFLRRALDAVDQAAIATDEDGLVCYWNPAAEKMFGYTSAQAGGRSVADLVIPESDGAHALASTALLAAGVAYTGDWEVQGKDGRRFLAHIAAAAVTDPHGRVVGTLGLVHDVSARRATEQRLSRLAAIVADSEDAIIEMDLDGKIRSANAAVEQVFGYRPDELVGANVSALVPSGLQPEMLTVVAALCAGVPQGILSTTRRRKDGTLFKSALRLSPVRDEHGAIVGVSGITRDVTAEAATRQRLEDSERRFRARFDQVAIAQALISPAGTFIAVNDELCQLLQRERSELEGASVRELRAPHSGATDEDPLEAVYAGRSESGSCERVMSAPDGSPIAVLVSAALLRDAAGAPQEVVAFVQDLSGRVETETALRRSEARSRSIADTAQEGIWAIDTLGNTLYANSKLCDILGLPQEDLLERSVIDILNPSAAIADRIRNRQVRGAEEYEIPYEHPDGLPRVLHFSASPLPADPGEPSGGLGMVTDVTSARSAETALRHRAQHDELTGLANRTLLGVRLKRALAKQRKTGRPVAVLFADLDQFKLVNDSWGHAAGDDLLVQVAARLTAAARPNDTVCRFGGDEFVIVCENTDERQACELASQLLTAFTDPIQVGNEHVYVGASVGIAVSPPSESADLLRHADTAMYAAKTRGRGRYQVFDHTLATEAANRLELSRDLRDALDRDELTLHYQPTVDLGTGRILGVEALARWDHPRRGAVSPTEFVAVAESTGLAIPLDRWVLRRACRDYASLRTALGESAHVAVNISARHLNGAGLETLLLNTLGEFDVPAAALILEVTESALMDDPDEARLLLKRLRARGVSVAIDDFGTGFSSLSHLATLPAASLKIDRCFIEKINEDPAALAIVTSILDMARAMSLTSVAEGIETTSQLTALRQLGCKTGQGFLWSPALALDDLISTVHALDNRHFPVLPAYPAVA